MKYKDLKQQNEALRQENEVLRQEKMKLIDCVAVAAKRHQDEVEAGKLDRQILYVLARHSQITKVDGRLVHSVGRGKEATVSYAWNSLCYVIQEKAGRYHD